MTTRKMKLTLELSILGLQKQNSIRSKTFAQLLLFDFLGTVQQGLSAQTLTGQLVKYTIPCPQKHAIEQTFRLYTIEPQHFGTVDYLMSVSMPNLSSNCFRNRTEQTHALIPVEKDWDGVSGKPPTSSIRKVLRNVLLQKSNVLNIVIR